MVVGLNRTLVEAKIAIFESPSVYFSFKTCITYRLTTEQMPYFALIENKRITVYVNQISFVWTCYVLYEEVPVTIWVLVPLNVIQRIKWLFP